MKLCFMCIILAFFLVADLQAGSIEDTDAADAAVEESLGQEEGMIKVDKMRKGKRRGRSRDIKDEIGHVMEGRRKGKSRDPTALKDPTAVSKKQARLAATALKLPHRTGYVQRCVLTNKDHAAFLKARKIHEAAVRQWKKYQREYRSAKIRLSRGKGKSWKFASKDNGEKTVSRVLYKFNRLEGLRKHHQKMMEKHQSDLSRQLQHLQHNSKNINDLYNKFNSDFPPNLEAQLVQTQHTISETSTSHIQLAAAAVQANKRARQARKHAGVLYEAALQLAVEGGSKAQEAQKKADAADAKAIQLAEVAMQATKQHKEAEHKLHSSEARYKKLKAMRDSRAYMAAQEAKKRQLAEEKARKEHKKQEEHRHAVQLVQLGEKARRWQQQDEEMMQVATKAGALVKKIEVQTLRAQGDTLDLTRKAVAAKKKAIEAQQLAIQAHQDWMKIKALTHQTKRVRHAARRARRFRTSAIHLARVAVKMRAAARRARGATSQLRAKSLDARRQLKEALRRRAATHRTFSNYHNAFKVVQNGMKLPKGLQFGGKKAMMILYAARLKARTARERLTKEKFHKKHHVECLRWIYWPKAKANSMWYKSKHYIAVVEKARAQYRRLHGFSALTPTLVANVKSKAEEVAYAGINRIQPHLLENVLELKAFAIADHERLLRVKGDKGNFLLGSLGTFLWRFGMTKNTPAWSEFKALVAVYRRFYRFGLGEYMLTGLRKAMTRGNGLLVLHDKHILMNSALLGLKDSTRPDSIWSIRWKPYNRVLQKVKAINKDMIQAVKQKHDFVMKHCKCVGIGGNKKKYGTCKKHLSYDKWPWCVVNHSCVGAATQKGKRLGVPRFKWKQC